MDGLALSSDFRSFPNKSNGILVIGSQTDWVLFTNVEETNDLYLAAAVWRSCKSYWTPSLSATSRVHTVTSCLEFSSKGLPRSSNACTKQSSSSRDLFWKLFPSSWCNQLSLTLLMPNSSWKSLVNSKSLGCVTNHLLNASSFWNNSMVPPFPLRVALHCSWFWSSAMAENRLRDFVTTKLPWANSSIKSEPLSSKVSISRICTEAQRALRWWFNAKNQGQRIFKLLTYIFQLRVRMDLTKVSTIASNSWTKFQ